MAEIIATLQEHEALFTRMDATEQFGTIVESYIKTLIKAQRVPPVQVAEQLRPEDPTTVRRAPAAAQPAARTTEPFGHQTASPAHRADDRKFLPRLRDETLEYEETHTTRVRTQPESLFAKARRTLKNDKES